LIHAQEFAALFLHPLGCPIVCTIHGTMFSEVSLNRRYFSRLSLGDKAAATWRYKSRILLHPFFCSMLKRAQLLLVDSDYTRRELLRIRSDLRNKISLVPLGIDFSRYTPRCSETEETLSIALLGRLQEIKGLRVVAEAAALLKQRKMDVRFRIGGIGAYRRELSAFIRSHGLEDRMELVGAVLPQDVSQFLSQSHVFLFPDLTQPAFGLVAVEAMHHGLPVIAARSGAIPETVTEDTGWIYDPWSATELAGLIEQISGQRALIAQKAAVARSRADEYSAETMAVQVEKAYLRLLGRQ
jgi:glycosyltransferase involved in cell wall biosynthesis